MDRRPSHNGRSTTFSSSQRLSGSPACVRAGALLRLWPRREADSPPPRRATAGTESLDLQGLVSCVDSQDFSNFCQSILSVEMWKKDAILLISPSPSRQPRPHDQIRPLNGRGHLASHGPHCKKKWRRNALHSGPQLILVE